MDVAVMRTLLLLVLALMPAVAFAGDDVDAALNAELDRARAQVASQVQLTAYDLLDELVYGLTQEPIFGTPTPVVLAGVSVPVGLGTGMQALLENHLSDALIRHPSTSMQLVHCPSCSAVVVHSGPEGTVLTRGVDNPALLSKLGESTGQHALFIDIEAEGAWLVLRARVTRLTPELPIVWSHTLATSASTPALLRDPTELKSAVDARAEYLAMLHDRGHVAIPLRFSVRSYAAVNRYGTSQRLGATPLLFIQSGAELTPDPRQAWLSSFILGYAVIPEAYQGVMGQSRFSRLLTGSQRSLTQPDLYGFIGGSVISLWGPAAASFRNQELTVDELLTDTSGDDPRTTFSTIHFGLDLRLGNRVGLSSFLETIPSLRSSQNIGNYLWLFGLQWQTFGTEVTFWF